MDKFFEFLKVQKFSGILLLIGSVILLLSLFQVDFDSKTVSQSSNVFIVGVVIGSFAMLVAIALYLFDKYGSDAFVNSKVEIKELDDTVVAKFFNTNINIRFGRLEKLVDDSKKNGSVVVLPANEFFDDKCINDPKSSLGAYVAAKLTNRQNDVLKAIKEKLVADKRSHNTIVVAGNKKESYGVGVAVLVDKIGEEKLSVPIMFVSVTTERDEGLRAEPAYICNAMRAINSEINKERIESIYIPTIGAGHGGVRTEVVLNLMLISICDMLRRDGGRKPENVNIVVFQNTPEDTLSTPVSVAKQVLRTTISMHSISGGTVHQHTPS